MNVTDVIDGVHAWALGEFAAEFKRIVKGVDVAELGRWRQTLPMLAVRDVAAVDELVTLAVGGQGMRRLTVDVAFDVMDTSEVEVRRLRDVVYEALRDDPSWGGSVDAGDVRLRLEWAEVLDVEAGQDPLPFLVGRVAASGLTFGT